MLILFWCLWALYLLIVARWCWGVVELSRTNTDHMALAAQPDRAPQPDDPSLTVLIAAHNEGDNIENCLDRLRQQNYTLREIIVVNDRSTDSTGEVISRLARNDPRIHRVDIKELPA